MTHPHNIIEKMKFGRIHGTIFKKTNAGLYVGRGARVTESTETNNKGATRGHGPQV